MSEELSTRGLAVLTFLNGLPAEAKAIAEKHFFVEGSAAAYIGLVSALADAQLDQDPSLLRPALAPADVIGELTRRVTEKTFSSAELRTVRVLLKIQTEWDWDPLISGMRGVLSGGDSLEGDFLGSILGSAGFLGSVGVESSDGLLRELAQNGHLLHHLYGARAEGDIAAEGALVTLMAELLPKANVSQNVGNSANGLAVYNEDIASPSSDLVDRVTNFLLLSNRFSRVVVSAESTTEIRPLVQEVIKGVAGRPDAQRWIAPKLLALHFSWIRRGAGDSFVERALADDVYRSQLLDAVMERGFLKGAIDLYLLTLAHAPPTDEYLQFLVEGIRSIAKESWETSLKRGDALLSLALQVHEIRPLELSGPLRNAMLDHAAASLGKEPIDEKVGGLVAQLVGVMSEESRQTFLRDLRDAVLQERDASPVLSVYGPLLLDQDLLAEKPDDLVRVFFRSAVSRGNVPELQWMISVIQEARGAVENAPPASVDSFKEDLRARLLEDNGGSDLLRQIAALMDVEVPPTEATETSE